MSTTTALEQMRAGARANWAAGDFPEIARRDLWKVGARIVDLVGVRAAERVLDVACGTGNAAIRAAEAGGEVVGVDLTPELFEAGREQAAEAGVELEWVEGDAEDLPFPDGSFDVVLSTFGVMFAPRHEVAAGELARVLRPGGRMGLTNWTADGVVGQMFRTMGSYLPAPPPVASGPPVLWGSEQHVRHLFAGTGVELSFAREATESAVRLDSFDEEIEFRTKAFGPLMMAKKLTEAQGRWEELRGELEAVWNRNEPMEYLITLGSKE
jgi:SAM-dependent methyltransferase